MYRSCRLLGYICVATSHCYRCLRIFWRAGYVLKLWKVTANIMFQSLLGVILAHAGIGVFHLAHHNTPLWKIPLSNFMWNLIYRRSTIDNYCQIDVGSKVSINAHHLNKWKIKRKNHFLVIEAPDLPLSTVFTQRSLLRSVTLRPPHWRRISGIGHLCLPSRSLSDYISGIGRLSPSTTRQRTALALK